MGKPSPKRRRWPPVEVCAAARSLAGSAVREKKPENGVRRLAARRGPLALSRESPLRWSSGPIEEAHAGDGGGVRDAALRRGPGDGWGRVLGRARGDGATASGNRKKRGRGRPDAEPAKGVPKGDVAKADEGRVHQAPPCAAACRRGRRGPGIGQGATRRRQEALSQSEKRVVMREKATTAGIVHCFLKRFHTLVGGVCPGRGLVNAFARAKETGRLPDAGQGRMLARISTLPEARHGR